MIKQSSLKILGMACILYATIGISAFLWGQTGTDQSQKYRDGVYQGKSEGFVDDIIVEVKIDKGRIRNIAVIEHSESNAQTAPIDIPRRIVEKQNTEGIDAVTGSTYTSQAIVNAVNDALKKASGDKPSTDEFHPQKPVGKKSLGAGTHLLPTPVWVIGSYDMHGKPNMMTAAWVGICCSRPPCVTVSLRKATYTYGNIMERKAFTVNIPSKNHAEETAFFGRVSGRDVDKLLITGLTPVKGDSVDAPYLQEFFLNIECRVIHTYEVGLHTMFIAEIKDVKADESILGENGRPDLQKLMPFVFSPASSGFYKTGEFLGKIDPLAEKYKKE